MARRREEFPSCAKAWVDSGREDMQDPRLPRAVRLPALHGQGEILEITGECREALQLIEAREERREEGLVARVDGEGERGEDWKEGGEERREVESDEDGVDVGAEGSAGGEGEGEGGKSGLEDAGEEGWGDGVGAVEVEVGEAKGRDRDGDKGVERF